MKVEFLGKRLLIITAHPDDESYGVAGTIIENHRRGGQTFLACATFGEQGRSHVANTVTTQTLAKIRQQELRQVCKLLKIKQAFTFGLPDKKLNINQTRLASKIAAVIKQVKPDYLISFGPDGLTGHTDHVAIGKATRVAARKFRLPFVAFAAPPLYYKNFNQMLKRRRFGNYQKTITPPQTNIKIKIASNIKLRAIKLHKSQYTGDPFRLMPKTVKQAVLHYEYFKV